MTTERDMKRKQSAQTCILSKRICYDDDPIIYRPVSFRITDSQNTEMFNHLRKYGYVVIDNVLDNTEVRVAQDLFWRFMHGLDMGINMTNPKTWHNWPGNSSNGIICDHGIGQSEFMWNIRVKVKNVFETLYFRNPDEPWNKQNRGLMTSFDGACAFRPSIVSNWKTKRGLYHVDKDQCIQGLVNLFDSDSETGGFVVLPKSHKRYDRNTFFLHPHVIIHITDIQN